MHPSIIPLCCFRAEWPCFVGCLLLLNITPAWVAVETEHRVYQRRNSQQHQRHRCQTFQSQTRIAIEDMHDRPEGIEYGLADQYRNTPYAVFSGELVRHERIHCGHHLAILIDTACTPEGGRECCVDLLALHRPVIHNNHEPNTKHTIHDHAEDLPELNPFCIVDSTCEVENVIREPLSSLSAELGADRVPRSIKTCYCHRCSKMQINTYIPRLGFAGYHCCRDAMLLEGLPHQHHGVEIRAS
mmetsp:Transcript_76402/g.247852  ORF Transcript_76402/g.247852 Transcript_76402/m.247852 type:complete len:243 (+) Transcript_76402:2476-3204(+)